MNVVETGFPGLLIIEPQVFDDDRGCFFESYNEAAFAEAGIRARFVQDSESHSRYGVIRGLHAQSGEHAQAKLVRAVAGTVLDVAVDARRGSPTCGKWFATELSGENRRQMFIPRGFLHGFSVLSETAVFQYKSDNLYDRESETGVRYDDPSLGIDWRLPAAAVIVSEKDGLLRDFSSCCL